MTISPEHTSSGHLLESSGHLLNDLNWYVQEIWSKRLNFFQKKVIKRPDSRVFLGSFSTAWGREGGGAEREGGRGSSVLHEHRAFLKSNK